MYPNIKNPKLLTVAAVILIVILAFATATTRMRQIKDANDFQNQVNYTQNTKKLYDEKSFIERLPYKTDNYDIFYSTVNDQIQVIMKTPGMNFAEAKATYEEEVKSFLEAIGVPETQSVVWLKAQ